MQWSAVDNFRFVNYNVNMKSRYIEDYELQKLRKFMTARQWLPFEVALHTGLRIGDVLKIKKTDIDEKKGILSYVSEKRAKRGDCRIAKSLCKKMLSNSKTSEYCFASRRSKSGHITRQAAWKWIKDAAERANIDISGVSPHAFRKVYAVELYKEKGIEAVKNALQHERADTTQIYALADFSTGRNAKLPLLRGDLQLLTRLIIEQIRSIEDGRK